MAFWVYILKCADGKFYTGQTDDLERRMGEHQYGGFCDFTSRRRPVELVWSDYYQTRGDAIEVEKQIKSWSRGKKIGLINGDWEVVSFYARPPHERPSTALGTNGDRDNPNEAGKAESSMTLVRNDLGSTRPRNQAPLPVCPERSRGTYARHPLTHVYLANSRGNHPVAGARSGACEHDPARTSGHEAA